MKTVNVLARIDALLDLAFENMGREGKLNEHAVHFGIGVEDVDAIEQFAFGGLGGKSDDFADDARVAAGFFLVVHVDFARRIVADEHDRQARPRPVSR